MYKKRDVFRFIFLLCVAVIFTVLLSFIVPAQSYTEPRLSHNICVAHCVIDTTILRSNKGDTQAKNEYHGWYDTYFEGTGCNQSSWRTMFEYLLSVIGEIVGSPGGATLQCWQGLLALTHQCSGQCSDYFIANAKFGPNVRLTKDVGAPGYFDVTLDNNNHGYLPEESPNAYSLHFDLLSSLQLNDGTALLFDQRAMPSMSFSNWITRGGLSDCLTEYGTDDTRCELLATMDTANIIPVSVDFYDGALYDLSDHFSDAHGVNGTFSEDGYVLLDSNDETITIDQGDYRGYFWTKINNKSKGFQTNEITYWDANGGSITITNSECNNLFCGIFGDRTDSDIYIYALQGPPELRLPGTYTVQVVADVLHDKDFSDNTITYNYTHLDVENPPGDGDNGEDDQEEPNFAITDLPIIDLPGPGTYPGMLPDDLPGLMYRLNVPDDVHSFFIRLVSLDAGNFMYFGRAGSIPVPNYPQIIPGTYYCHNESDGLTSNGCSYPTQGFDYYLFVPNEGSGRQFQLEVTWVTQPDAQATLAYRQTQQALDEEDQTQTYTELEPNDDRDTANAWDMIDPFTGLISNYGDEDTILVQFSLPGIYTFTLTAPEMDAFATLRLLRAPSGGVLGRIDSEDEPPQLMMDASAGEQYFFKVDSYGSLGEGGLPYQLALTGFITDPYESNDERSEATPWDLTAGSIQGYFWDKTTGRADYYTFTAPQTQAGIATTFTVSNPLSDLRIRMTLLEDNGAYLVSSPLSPAGEPNSLSYVLEGGQAYTLKLNVFPLTKTSTTPYTLDVDIQTSYEEPGSDDEDQPVRLYGYVVRQSGLIPIPLSKVAIYAKIAGEPAFLLDTTNFLGRFSSRVRVAEGEVVQLWPVKDGTSFLPEEDLFYFDPGLTRHRSVFVMVGGQLVQETPQPTSVANGTPLPPIIQTGLAITDSALQSTPTHRVSPTLHNTATPSAKATVILPTPSPTQVQGEKASISGSVWRLFANSEPAGIAGAEVILSINDVEQPAVISQIDGTYTMDFAGIQPGDVLRIRAQASQDDFEPIFYEWQAEQGVNHWNYDFYSYWEILHPPQTFDQNRFYGRVVDEMGIGVSDLFLIVKMGDSDAYQRLGPTDNNGYYDGQITLPNRVMVTLWVDAAGFLPSRQQFFHPFDPEDREINFWR